MSAMWTGRLERLVPPPALRASRSMELMSPTSSRRLASSSSRKWSSSRLVRPEAFFFGREEAGLDLAAAAGADGLAAARPALGRVARFAVFFTVLGDLDAAERAAGLADLLRVELRAAVV